MKNAILIVDDSRLNRETLADILKDKYNIIEAEDGRSGLEVLEKRKDDIVLVIPVSYTHLTLPTTPYV